MCDLFAAPFLDIAKLVDGSIRGGQSCERAQKNSLHFSYGPKLFGAGAGDRETEFGHLLKRQQRFSAADAETNAAGDLRQPGAEGLGVAKPVDVPPGSQERLDQDILSILTVAADAQHLAIDRVFVLIGEGFEVHRS